MRQLPMISWRCVVHTHDIIQGGMHRTTTTRIKRRPNVLVHTQCCDRDRRARNTFPLLYGTILVWRCHDGKGCQKLSWSKTFRSPYRDSNPRPWTTAEIRDMEARKKREDNA